MKHQIGGHVCGAEIVIYKEIGTGRDGYNSEVKFENQVVSSHTRARERDLASAHERENVDFFLSVQKMR